MTIEDKPASLFAADPLVPRKRGRPTPPNPRNKKFSIRVTQEELDKLMLIPNASEFIRKKIWP